MKHLEFAPRIGLLPCDEHSHREEVATNGYRFSWVEPSCCPRALEVCRQPVSIERQVACKRACSIKKTNAITESYLIYLSGMDVATAIFHCQACAYRVTCLTDSPGTLICFIGVIRHYHSAPGKLQPGWFTELLLSLGISLVRSPHHHLELLVVSVCPKSETAGFLKECRRVGLIGQCRRSNRAMKLEQRKGIALAGRLGLKPNPHESRVGRVWSCAP